MAGLEAATGESAGGAGGRGWYGLLLVGVVVAGGWWLAAGRAAGAVVAQDLDVTCIDGQVDRVAVDDAGNVTHDLSATVARVASVQLADGLDCRLEVALVNRARHAVTLTEVTFPFFGPTSAMGPLGSELSGVAATPARNRDADDVAWLGRDATWTLSHRLEPDEGVRLSLRFGLNPQACLDQGDHALLYGLPEIRTRVLGRTVVADLGGDQPNVHFVGSADARCTS